MERAFGGAMLKKMLDRLKALTVEPTPYDPSALDDPVALRTAWTPAKGGGASFGTHQLLEVDSFRIEFRPTGGALLFYGIFLVIGLVALIGGSVAALSGAADRIEGAGRFGLLVPILVGAVFTAVGGGLLRSGSAPIVFDKRRDAYWRGRVAPHELSNRHGHESSAELEEIHAVQLLSELCSSKDSSYYSYELNLVLRDGERLNVVDHGNHEAIRDQGRRVAGFLDVPFWDAT